jgi:hypothetical protein
MINIDEYKKLPKEAELHILLELLQEVGANIYNCRELFKLYWLDEMADAANKYIEFAKKIKSRILEIKSLY